MTLSATSAAYTTNHGACETQFHATNRLSLQVVFATCAQWKQFSDGWNVTIMIGKISM
jgi:hypothetical protein